MPRDLRRTDKFVDSALEQLTIVSTVYEMRACLSMVLVNAGGFTLKETGAYLGVGVSTVTRLRNAYQNNPSGVALKRSGWGGRRHSYMSIEQEKKFLLPFVERAKVGELVIIASIQEAFERKPTANGVFTWFGGLSILGLGGFPDCGQQVVDVL